MATNGNGWLKTVVAVVTPIMVAMFVCVIVMWSDVRAACKETERNKASIERLDNKYDSYLAALNSVDQRLSRIEGALGIAKASDAKR